MDFRITATDVLAPAGTLYGMEIGTWCGFRWVRSSLRHGYGRRAKARRNRRRLEQSGWGRKSARRKRGVR